MRPSTPTSVRTYGMHERADHLDFDIRFQGARNELTLPHRHAYFQIQVGIEGSSQQSIGGEVRPFGPRHLSFVLPYRVHVIPHSRPSCSRSTSTSPSTRPTSRASAAGSTNCMR